MYRVLYEYGGYEGMQFARFKHDGVRKFDTAEEALEWQLSEGYHDKFQIVKIVKFKESE